MMKAQWLYFSDDRCQSRKTHSEAGMELGPEPRLQITSGRSHAPRGGDDPFERLPYQLSMVAAVPTMVTTGDGESGFDSGEGA